MRFRPLLPALGLALAAGAAAPAPAAALGYSGFVGAQYARDDVWLNGGTPRGTPHLDLNLGLSLDGFVYKPGALSYSLGGEYRRASETRPGERETVQDRLQYRGRATLFGDPRTPLALSLHAVRTTETSAATPTSPIGLDVESTSYGVDARYRQPQRPTASASFSRSETTSHVPLLPDARRATNTFAVSTGNGTAGFSYGASYTASLSEGTYATDAFDSHRVSVTARARVADRVEAGISDSYYLRLPTARSPFSPRQELNSVYASLTRRGARVDFDQFGYSYSRGVQVAEGAQDLDRTSQQLRYATQRVLPNPEWRLRGNVDASLFQNRVGTVEHRDAGQSLGTNLVWTRDLPNAGNVELRGGPSVGVVEPDGRSAQFGYGATAGGAYRRLVGFTTYAASYDVSFSSDIGNLGTTFTQSAQGSATSPVGTGSVRGTATLAAQRRDSPHLGAAASRMAVLGGGYTWRRYNLFADVGVTSGVSSPVADAGVGDGLFLSLPYDTHTYTASAGASAGVTQRLTLDLVGRFLAVSAPDRPDQQESEARFSLRYSLGGLGLQFDERYLVSQVPGGTVRRNVLFVSVYRSFGSR